MSDPEITNHSIHKLSQLEDDGFVCYMELNKYYRIETVEGKYVLVSYTEDWLGRKLAGAIDHERSELSRQVCELENERRGGWTSHRQKLAMKLDAVTCWMEQELENMQHDCGNFDGGSTATCEACQTERSIKESRELLAQT